VQVSAGGIDPQGPGGTGKALPGGEGQTVIEKLGDGGNVQRLRGDEAQKGLVIEDRAFWRQWKPDLPSAGVAAKGVRLAGPVQEARTGRELICGMLGGLMIGYDGIRTRRHGS